MGLAGQPSRTGVDWVFARGYDARSGRWIRVEGADQYEQVGTLAPRRSVLSMRAGERRQLDVDTVVEFPAGESLDSRSFISVGATLLKDDDGFNNSDQSGSHEDGYEYRWRPATGGPGGEVRYREGDGRVRPLFRPERVSRRGCVGPVLSTTVAEDVVTPTELLSESVGDVLGATAIVTACGATWWAENLCQTTIMYNQS